MKQATLHASCAALGDDAVLLRGPPGSGKSDLVLRLLDLGFTLVADDRVMVIEGLAKPPDSLRGLLEVRGLGIVHLPYLMQARLRLVATLRPGCNLTRLPQPSIDPQSGLPIIEVDPWHASAAQFVALALRCAAGLLTQAAGPFAP